MDSYIIRIYRRDNNNQPLAGTIEYVGSNPNSLQNSPFNNRDKLWSLLSLPKKKIKSNSQINETEQNQ